LSRQEAAITLEEALERLQLLETQINQLQATIADIESRMNRLSSVEDALMNLKDGSNDVLVPLEPTATVIVRGEIKPLDKVIIHAGLNVFIEVNREKALEILREERANLSKLLNVYNQELSKIVQYYNALKAAVEESLATAQQQQGTRQTQS
jgi:prefoldin alpha subunit